MQTVPQPGALLGSLRSSLAGIGERAAGLQPKVVWAVWLVLTVWALVFVARHGHNLPTCDEWVFVSIYYAPWAERLPWLVETHQEHRFIAARAVFLVLLDLTGHDFRAGMFLSAALLSAAGASLVLAARRLRGRGELLEPARRRSQGA